jgi:hypothetical protein
MPAINRTYYVPGNLNGYYYLVLYADATGKIAEQNEQNNFFYTSNQTPKLFASGLSQRQAAGADNFINELSPTINAIKSNIHNTAITPLAPNAYTPEEIAEFFKEQKKSGVLQKKLDSYLESTKTGKSGHPY